MPTHILVYSEVLICALICTEVSKNISLCVLVLDSPAVWTDDVVRCSFFLSFYQPHWIWPKQWQRPNWHCSIRRNKCFIPVENIKYYSSRYFGCISWFYSCPICYSSDNTCNLYLYNSCLTQWNIAIGSSVSKKNPNMIVVNSHEIMNLSLELQYKIQICLSYSVGTKFRMKLGSKKGTCLSEYTLQWEKLLQWTFIKDELSLSSSPFFPLHLGADWIILM